MINVFERTSEEKGALYNGEVFVKRQINQELKDEFDKVNAEYDKYRIKLTSTLMTALKLIFFFLGIILVGAGILSFGKDYSENVKITFLISTLVGLGLLFLYFIIRLIEWQKEKRAGESQVFEKMIKREDELIDLAKNQLKVPKNAVNTDIFVKDIINKKSVYLNMNFYAFKEGDNLCLSDNEKVYAFPLSQIKDIVKVEKRLKFSIWNKEENPSSEPYNVKYVNFSSLSVNCYYSLKIERDSKDYEILFPHYELETINKYCQKQIH